MLNTRERKIYLLPEHRSADVSFLQSSHVKSTLHATHENARVFDDPM